MKHQPITDRFTRYSDDDARADAMFDKFRDHGGAFLHELPPAAQRCIYAAAAEIAALKQRCLEEAEWRLDTVAKHARLTDELRAQIVAPLAEDVARKRIADGFCPWWSVPNQCYCSRVFNHDGDCDFVSSAKLADLPKRGGGV